MANPDRLSALDATFLHLEDDSTAHMHVASVMIFAGTAPTHEELIEHVCGRLHLVPRYRQRLAYVPLSQGRPVWCDDPHFNPSYHVRLTALPKPEDDAALKRLAGRLFSQRLDRSKPLWEIFLVQRMSRGRFALIAKTHHALVDGISGVDITTVMFDLDPTPTATARPPATWAAQPLPGPAKLLGEALLERTTVPAEMARGARALIRTPRRVLARTREGIAAVGATTLAGINAPAPPTPFNVDIGPHRRYEWVDADLARFKAIKDNRGGTLNDVILAVVSLALGRYLRAHGQDTRGLVLKAMVPVSVRPDTASRTTGNQVAAMWAPLPVGAERPLDCLEQVRISTEDVTRSGQAVGAEVLTNLAGLAPPTILSQAARLQARQRFFNLVVTNVPGPQLPLYLLGRRLQNLYPVVPLARRQAIGIAVMSYNGHLGFGLLADYDALADLDQIAKHLRASITALSRAAAGGTGSGSGRSASPRGRTPPRASVSPRIRTPTRSPGPDGRRGASAAAER